MPSLQVGIIVNLQEPGEHSKCGDGIDDQVGFAYNPEKFQAHGIATFNWFWEDLTCPTKEMVLMICQNMSRYERMGKRIFVHCHAGTGRTGLVIASFLFYNGMATSGADAVSKVKTQRKGSLGRKSQANFVVSFCEWLAATRCSYFPTPNGSPISYCQLMRSNLQLVHGKDVNDYKFFPKFPGVCLQRLIDSGSDASKKLSVALFLATYTKC